MAKLPGICCKRCGTKLISKTYSPTKAGRAPVATCYKKCLRICQKCGIGYSNSKKNPKRIYNHPFQEIFKIPSNIASNWENVIGKALNERNRENKKKKFAFHTSEDHVTWVVFKYLHRNKLINKTLTKMGIITNCEKEPVLLLWGVPIPHTEAGEKVRSKIKGILKSENINESSGSLSEPDVILDYGEKGIIIIEVKLHSTNDKKKKKYKNWEKYESEAFKNYGNIKKSGLYELTRNWRLAWEYSASGPMTLINLGPKKLFCKSGIKEFEENLNTNKNKQFRKIAWDDFMDAINSKPPWYVDYLVDRKVIKKSQ